MVLGFLSFFSISAAALILNDYFDLAIDRVNAPHRPLPAGIVTKRDVLILSSAVAFLGFLASLLISPLAILATVVVWIVGFLYNWRFKRAGLIGNLMVSFSVGMTFVFGGIAVGQPTHINVWWFGTIAALIDLGEEIAADAMDMDGDRLIGSRSLAIVYGRARALKAGAVIFGAVILVSLAPFVLHAIALIYLVPIAIMDLVILYSTIRLLDPASENPRAYIRAIYLSGLGAVLVFIGLRLVL
jgi:geranylgeranylglycerol-phosphate geranylgeranyltransferase